MKNINSFKIDRNLDAVEQNKILKNFIENFSNNKNLDSLVLELSKMYKIPPKYLSKI